MLIDTARELLANAELFSRLPESSLARLAATATEAQYAEGEVLFRQGDPADCLHIIVGGVVQVLINGEPEPTVVAVLGPGECVGELSLIDGRERSATVEALEPVHTVILPRDEFLEIIRSHVPTMEVLLHTVVQRLRQTDALAADIGTLRGPA